MSEQTMAKPSRERIADELAQAHYDLDAGLERVIELRSDRESDQEPIKLLEVNAATVRAGVQPVYFGAHPASGMVYPSIVVEIGPEEMDHALEELRKRYGWTPAREIPPRKH